MEVAVVVYKYFTVIGAWLVLFIWIFVLPAAAQDIKVTLIEVQGNKRIETATILARLRTKEGEVFSPAVIKEDIKSLYQLGHFEDVQVKTEGFEQGLKVIFVVKEKPLIREIIFEGNDELSTETLKEGFTLLPRTAYNIQLITESAEKLRLKYQDKGFYEAVVIPVANELRSGDRNVVFYIVEGKKVELNQVIIYGNKNIPSKEIKKALKNEEWWLFSYFGHSGILRMDELKEDVETIKNIYFNKGFIEVQVGEPIIAFKDNKRKNKLILQFNVKEGDQFRVESVSFKGNSIFTDAELAKNMKLKKGDVFSRAVLKQDVSKITDSYDSKARPFANVAPQFNIDHQKRTVALTMDIQEGGEVRIGRIDITGNTKTRDKVIRREMRLEEGDLYSKQLLKRSFDRITNLNFFETLEIVPDRKPDSIMDLAVKVKEKNTGNISVGGGYSSADHLMGFIELSQGNLFGLGELIKIRAALAAAGTTNSYSASFMEPYLFDKPIWGRVDVYDQTVEYDGYDVKSLGAGLTIGKSLSEYVSTSLKYGFDQSVISLSTAQSTNPPPSDLVQQVVDYGNTLTTSALFWTLARDSRDNYMDPRSGSRNSIFIEYAGGFLGGNTNFYKALADSAWYFPSYLDTTFLVRGRFGNMESLITSPVPIYERWYVGGPTSVRGFKYGGAGPVDIYGNRLGGTQEVIFNFEFIFPLYAPARLKGVLFYDAGRGIAPHESINISELAQAAGFGIWWFSPFGPLKFDFGFAIHKQKTDQTSVFDFSIGSNF